MTRRRYLPCDRTHREAIRLLRFLVQSMDPTKHTIRIDSTEWEPWVQDRLCKWLQRYDRRRHG